MRIALDLSNEIINDVVETQRVKVKVALDLSDESLNDVIETQRVKYG